MLKITQSVIMISLAAMAGFSQTEDPKFEDYLANEKALLPVAGELIYDCARISGYSGGTRIDVEETEVPFTMGYRVRVSQAGANPWEPQFQTPVNQRPLQDGDMLYYVFYARTVDSEDETGQAKGTFYAQRAESPWTTIFSLQFSPERNWTRYHVYGEVSEDYDAGQMGVTIHLGYFRQTIEFGGFIALNLGQGIDPDDLPDIKITYAGRGPDAPWRAQAEERIEKNRKGDLTVHVVNGDGENVKDAVVEMEMQKHAYYFGNFISSVILENSADASNYEEEFFKLFNAATTPFYMGDGTWGWYRGEDVRQQYQAMAGWLQDEGVHTKGHVLIWPGWNWLPPHIRNLENDPDGLRQALLDHLDEVVPVGMDLGLAQWDVMNEPYTNHDLMDILGEEEIAVWYNRVHDLHPGARLILNETNVISNGGNIAVQDNLARIIEMLQAAGAPLHGIGVQCHFGSSLTSPEKVVEYLDRFAAYGLPIQVTEFDVDIDDEETQADYTRDFLTALFSHPATDKFIMWGFWEPVQWKPRGCMVRADWSTKPNYDAYMDLVYNQWWTDETGLTDRNGIYAGRGFLGRYKITVSKEGEKKSLDIDLGLEGESVAVTLPNASTSVSTSPVPPGVFRLKRNYPNPFNPVTWLDYQTDKAGYVSIKLFDVRGREVLSLVNTVRQPGEYSVCVEGSQLSSGIYFAQLSLDDRHSRKIKMMFLK